MVRRQTFGQRIPNRPEPPSRERAFAPAWLERPSPAPEPSYVSPDPTATSLDDELREWKRARKRMLPWRQLSLMAGLSFAIASFVVPSGVNDVLQSLLYVLSAAGFIAGLAKRKRAQS